MSEAGPILVRAIVAFTACAALGLAFVRVLLVFSRARARVALVMSRLLLVASLVAPLAAVLVPPQGFVGPPVQVWSTPRSGSGTYDERVARSVAEPAELRLTALTMPVPARAASSLAAALALFAAALLAAGASRGLAARRALARSLAACTPWRRVGRTVLAVSPSARAPFAAKLGGRSFVVLDAETFAARADRRLAVRHELQHHRQGDTRLALALFVATSLFGPLASAWRRSLRAIEELACDEALTRGARPVDVRLYATCLLSVAARATTAAGVPVLATALSRDARDLRRRILAMTNHRPGLPFATALLGASALAVTLAAACTSADLVHDHRISSADVTRRAALASDSRLTIDAHPVVVEELNRLVATPNGRRFVREGLARANGRASWVREQLRNAGLPEQLAAIPLVESGWDAELVDRRGQSERSLAPGSGGAGLWMFIPETARAYGLRVDAEVDERLDVEKETGAAIKLLGDLTRELGDPRLALAAYNQGRKHVAAAIAREGTRDAFTLIERGALNPYAARVYAAAIVMADPSVLEP